MSRSYKKAIFKDKGIGKRAYYRIIRRHRYDPKNKNKI